MSGGGSRSPARAACRGRNAMLGLAALAVLELTLRPTRFGLWRLLA